MADQEKPCDSFNDIRSCSSSLIRAPSWSQGVGAYSERPSRSESNVSDSDQQEHSDESLNPFRHLSIQISTVYLIRGKHGSSRNQPQSVASSSISATSSSSASYHVYQLNLKTESGHEWSVYRRYSQFHSLHQKLKARDPEIGKLNFPPKRRINSKASTIVQDRRRRLEEYLVCLINYVGRKPGRIFDGPSQPLQDLLLESGRSESTTRGPSPSARSSLTDSASSEPSVSSAMNSLNEMNVRPNIRPRVSSESITGIDKGLGIETTIGHLLQDFINLRNKQSEGLDTDI